MMEDVGYMCGKLIGKLGDLLGVNVGVYVGVMYEEYQFYGVEEQVCGKLFVLIGNLLLIVNRVFYVFGFNGLSMVFDMMCFFFLIVIYLVC